MTMNKALHPKSNVERIYLPREKGGRGLISCESCVRSDESNLGWYVKGSDEQVLKAVARNGTIEIEATILSEEYKKKQIQDRKRKWVEKKMYGQYAREMGDGVDMKSTGRWPTKSDL